MAVQRFVNQVMAATIATVRPGGRPHAAVVLAACLDGDLYFAAADGSLLLGNLRRQSAISMTIAASEHDLTVHGEAQALGRAGDLPELVQALHRLSRRGQFLPRDWNGFLYAVRIDRIFLSS